MSDNPANGEIAKRTVAMVGANFGLCFQDLKAKGARDYPTSKWKEVTTTALSKIKESHEEGDYPGVFMSIVLGILNFMIISLKNDKFFVDDFIKRAAHPFLQIIQNINFFQYYPPNGDKPLYVYRKGLDNYFDIIGKDITNKDLYAESESYSNDKTAAVTIEITGIILSTVCGLSYNPDAELMLVY